MPKLPKDNCTAKFKRSDGAVMSCCHSRKEHKNGTGPCTEYFNDLEPCLCKGHRGERPDPPTGSRQNAPYKSI